MSDQLHDAMLRLCEAADAVGYLPIPVSSNNDVVNTVEARFNAALRAYRDAKAACPECDGSKAVTVVDWPGEWSNMHQEPCPKCATPQPATSQTEPRRGEEEGDG